MGVGFRRVSGSKCSVSSTPFPSPTPSPDGGAGSGNSTAVELEIATEGRLGESPPTDAGMSLVTVVEVRDTEIRIGRGGEAEGCIEDRRVEYSRTGESDTTSIKLLA